MTAYSLTTGQMLWNTTTTNVLYSGVGVADHGLVALLMQNGGFWEAWNLNTGTVAWTGQQMNYPWGQSCFGTYGCESAYGLIYWEGYDGVYAINWTNGNIQWHFSSPSAPFETPYSGNLPFDAVATLADGIIYTSNGAHTPAQPITRGWSTYAINATTGAEIWNVKVQWQAGGVADDYYTAQNLDDGYMYVFGMGQSETTVSAPQTQVTTGQNAVISGTVLDKSPGDLGSISNPQQSTDFPKAVPCVSDSSMATYMNYLYMQTPIDGIYHNETVTGVPVSIDAIDPNGNPVHIATVTSDGTTGTFAYTWTPTIAGNYKITATFAGDDSYGSSFATSYANVVNAPTTVAPTTSTITGFATTNDLETLIAVAVIAIIIAIAIATVLNLRKH